MTAQQITLETMTMAHLSGAVELSRQVGWPHRHEDWELVQSISQGIVALDEERVVATIMMTPYGDDAATINMVIVDASMRGRGLGRKMMEEALARAGARTCYLVATQEGLPFTKAWALPGLARSYSIKARHAMLTHRTTYCGARVAITHALWRSITWHMATSVQP